MSDKPEEDESEEEDDEVVLKRSCWWWPSSSSNREDLRGFAIVYAHVRKDKIEKSMSDRGSVRLLGSQNSG